MSGIEIDLVLASGSNLTCFCAGRKVLGFNLWIEIDLILSVGVEIDLVFVCGPRVTGFLMWGSIFLVFVLLVEIHLVFV